MNQPNRFVQALVLASSLTLAGGFVLYRAGVLDALLDTDGTSSPAFVDDAFAATERALPDTPFANPARNAPGDDASRTASDDSTPRRRTFLPGSKSGVFVDHDDRDSAVTDSEEVKPRREVFMGGSKSLAPLVAPSTHDSTKDSERRVFMGGSKSLAPLIEPAPSDTAGKPRQSSTKKSGR